MFKCLVLRSPLLFLNLNLFSSSGGGVSKPFRGGSRGRSSGGFGRGGSGAKRGGKREPAPSKEDLDKELDSYLQAR